MPATPEPRSRSRRRAREPSPRAADHEYRFDLFISYSHQDLAFARRLHRALTAYHPPRDLRVPQRGLRVFRDESDFQGPEYGAALTTMLESASMLLVLCSPGSRRSRYVGEEIERFVALRGPTRVVCALLAGQANNDDGASEENKAFPDALVAHLPIPLAADYRGWSDRDRVDRGRFESAWYKLLADIYAPCGVDRSAVEQRERLRRQRLRRRVTAATAALIVMLAALTTWALVSRREAIRQRNTAQSRFLAAQSASGAHPFELTLLLAVAAQRTSPSVEAWETLFTVLQRQPRVQRFLYGLSATAERLSVGRDGACVAAVVGSRTIVWSLDTDAAPEELPGQVMPDPSCAMLISASTDGRIEVRPRRPDGRSGWMAAGAGSPVSAWTIDVAGEKLAVAHTGGRLVVYDMLDGRVVAERADAPEPLKYLRFSADGAVLAAVEAEGRIHRWQTGDLTPSAPVVACDAGASWPDVVALSPDMRWCATGGPGRLTLSDITATTPRTFDLGTPWILALDFSHDSRTLMTGVQGGDLESWRVADVVRTEGTARASSWREHRTDVTATAYAADGSVVVSAARDRTLIVWQPAPANRLVSEVVRLRDAAAIGVDPDTMDVAFGTRAGDVWRGPASVAVASVMPLTNVGAPVTAVALQAGRLVVGTADGDVVSIDGPADGPRVVNVSQSPVVRLRFSPDRSRVAAVSENGAATVLSLDGWTPVATFAGGTPRQHRGGSITEAVDVAFAAEGLSLVTVHGDAQAFFWEWEAGAAQFVPVPFRPRVYVSSAAISPDGHLLALGTGIEEGEVVLIDRRSPGAPVVRLPAHELQDVTALAFSPDGRWLLSGGFDRRVAFWEVAGRRRLGNLHDAGAAVSNIAYASDGASAVTITSGGDIWRWELDPERWIARACQIANRDLAIEERGRFLDGQTLRVCPSQARHPDDIPP